MEDEEPTGDPAEGDTDEDADDDEVYIQQEKAALGSSGGTSSSIRGSTHKKRPSYVLSDTE